MANELLDSNLSDEELLAIKGSRGGRTGGGTGVGGGGGFAGAFGGGGSGFLSGGGGGMGLDALSARRRFIQGPNGAIPLMLSPMKAAPPSPDNVPAMLSQGEYVVNNRAMQVPGAQELVSALNAMGNGGGYAEGGMVLDPETLIRLLTVLSTFSRGGGQEPEHFAWGGAVQGQQGGFRAPRMPRNRLAGMGATGMPRMGQPAVRTNPRQPNAPPAPVPSPGGYTPGVTPQLGVPGGSWIPNPTNGANPDIGGLSDLPAFQQIGDLLRQYASGGAFSPEGSAALMRSVQGQATSNADAMRARQQNALSLGGMDPGQAAAMKQMADLRGQGDVANALNAAQYGQLANQQQFAQGLIGTMTQAQMQEYLAQLAAYYKQRVG